ncbi:hypothetical protein [Streptomyces sviceus]|uniref:hypothetical protein n=1 Tax=Streptomyces sviceus TaxID=285530 RepID=UPI003316CD21
MGRRVEDTLSWDSTTLVLATVRCGAVRSGPVTGIGTYAPAAAPRMGHLDGLLADVVVGCVAFDVSVVGSVRGTRPSAGGRRSREHRRDARIGGTTARFVGANRAYGAKQAVRGASAPADEGVTWFE